MIVAVTGASGFLGRALRRNLEARGVTVVQVPREGRSEAKVDALVHLAFPTDHSLRADRPMEALRSIVSTTTHAIELAERSRAHLILASSGKVYGPPVRLPVDESHPTSPSTRLGRLKLLAESMGRLAASDLGLAVTSLRIFNVFGPEQAPTFLVPKLVDAALAGAPLTLGELEHRRDWLYVDDVARAFEVALEHPASPGTFRALNVGSGSSASAREIVALVEREHGAPLRWTTDPSLARGDEPEEERADASAIRALGWSPRLDLEQGIAAHVKGRSSTIP
jgi:GDP-4-dehydro-6-deoxy-D-mannose reductase